MKYAFLILILLFSFNSFSKNIKVLSDSDSISQIASFLKDNQEDFMSSVLISDKKIKIPKDIIPSKVSALEVLSVYEKSFKRIIEKYPDEELPYEEAINDMKDFLDNQEFYKYEIDKNYFIEHDRKSIYFQSINNEINLRLDYIDSL